jgi:hypothetical protein
VSKVASNNDTVAAVMQAAGITEVEVPYDERNDNFHERLQIQYKNHSIVYRLQPRRYRVTVELTEKQYENAVNPKGYLFIGTNESNTIPPGSRLPIITEAS